jgi:leader peptidase (prepilin peptidase) / N-methyltransferase
MFADVPPFLAVAWAALVGAVVGSFLNVVIARVPQGESVVHPRSRCPRCRSPIAWYDNVPVLSWLLLRARCRGCGAPISWRYPLVELLGGCAGALAAHRHGISPAAAAELALVATLLALAFIDIDTWLLPHPLTWPLMVAGQAAAAFGLTGASPRSSALGLLLGVAAFATVAEVGQRVFRREAMGYGDVWLLGGLGSWLGVGALLPVVLLASLQGAVVGGLLVLVGRGQPGPSPEPGQAPQPAAAPGAEAPPPPPEEAGPAPAAAPPPAAEDEDWVPPRHAVPFGPFLALAALEWLYLAPLLGRAFPPLRFFT